MTEHVALDKDVIEDTAVIAEFVANGANGNGNGVHVAEAVDGVAEPGEDDIVQAPADEEETAVKSTSAR